MASHLRHAVACVAVLSCVLGLSGIPSGQAVEPRPAAVHTTSGERPAASVGGTLRVVVTGLPRRARARFVLRGPGGYRKSVRARGAWAPRTASKVFVVDGLRAGRYRLVPRPTRFAGAEARPRIRARQRVVRVGLARPARARFGYPVVVASRTEVVEPADVLAVTGTAGGDREVTLAGDTAYDVGSFLVSGPSAAAPAGLLTRVVGIEEVPGGTRYAVEQARLDEVLPSARIDTEVAADLGATTPARQGRRQPAGTSRRATITCESGAEFSITDTFSRELTMSVEGGWDWSDPSASYLKVTASASVKASRKIAASAEATCGIEERQLGPTIKLPTITLVVAGVPIVIVPVLQFFASASATVSAAADLTVGFEATSRAWLKASLGDGLSTGLQPPTVTDTSAFHYEGVTGELTGTLSARVSSEIYGVAGPYVQLNLTPTITAGAGAGSLRVDAGISVDVGLVAELCPRLFGIDKCVRFDKSIDGLLDYTWQLYPTHSDPVTRNGATTLVTDAEDDWYAATGTEATGLSADGRYLVFDTETSYSEEDTDSSDDVYLWDAVAQDHLLVSAGTGARGSVSADGRYVTYYGCMTPDWCDSEEYQIFLWDRVTGSTRVVSRARGGGSSDNGSYSSSISADGKFVAFESDASNLVVGDTNQHADVFLWERATGTTTRISAGSGGVQANDDSRLSGTGQLSGDGRYLAYSSYASNLVPDTGTDEGLLGYLYDRVTGRTRLLPGGAEATDISDDGRYLVMMHRRRDAIWDRETGAWKTTPSRHDTDLVLSGDGRYVAYVGPGTGNGWLGHLWDRETGQRRTFFDGTPDGWQPWALVISADGSTVGYTSDADDLVPGDGDGADDVFAWSRD